MESQGFVLYLSSLVAWIAFLVWGLCPDEVLEWMGVLWYPSRCVRSPFVWVGADSSTDREWALLFPAWTIMLAAFVYFSYIALNICITPALDSLHTLTGPSPLSFDERDLTTPQIPRRTSSNRGTGPAHIHSSSTLCCFRTIRYRLCTTSRSGS